MKKISLFALIISTLVACQSDKNSADTAMDIPAATGTINFANFYARYLEVEKQIKGQASFYEGDTLHTAHAITVPGGIQFQGNTMELKELQSSKRYLYNGSGDYPEAGFTFTYKDASGAAQTHTMQLAPIKDFSLKPSTDAGGMTIVLEGAHFEPDETLVILFSNAQNQTYSAETKVGHDTNEVAIPSQLLSKLSPGKKSVSLVKKKVLKSMQDNVEITSNIEYYTKTIDVQLPK